MAKKWIKQSDSAQKSSRNGNGEHIPHQFLTLWALMQFSMRGRDTSSSLVSRMPKLIVAAACWYFPFRGLWEQCWVTRGDDDPVQLPGWMREACKPTLLTYHYKTTSMLTYRSVWSACLQTTLQQVAFRLGWALWGSVHSRSLPWGITHSIRVVFKELNDT